MCKEYIVYTQRLARFLLERGFIFIRTTPDTSKPSFKNWVFPDSEELRAAVREYLGR